MTIPIGQGPDFAGVIDIIRMKARYFEPGGTAERVEDVDSLPAKYQEEARISAACMVARVSPMKSGWPEVSSTLIL